MRAVRVEDQAADARADFGDEKRGQRTDERHPRRKDGITFDGVTERTHGKIGQETVEGLKNDEECKDQPSVWHVCSPCNR